MMDVDQLLNSLGLAMGLPSLRFDPDRCARLQFDGRIEVQLEHDAAADTLQVYSVLGPVPARDRETLYAALLEGNLFCADTLGATLAVDPSAQEVLLCRTVAVASVGAPEFASIMEQFVASAEAWRERVAGGLITQPAALPAGFASPMRFDVLRG